jgi:hypothetical protein
MKFKVLNLAFILAFSVTAMGGALEQISDLDPEKSVELLSHFTVLMDQKDKNYKLIVDVQNPFTNTIVCEGNIPMVVYEEDGRPSSEIFKFSNLSVFPKKAFPQGSNYLLELPASFSSRDIEVEHRQSKIRCQGKHPHQFLPISYCRKNMNNHRNSCRMVESFGELRYYPVFQNGSLMGTCECE